MPSESDKSSRGALALKTAAVFLGVAALYLGLAWLQLGQTLQRGQLVEGKLNSAVSELNRGIADFQGDPTSAKDAIPAIEQSRSALGTLATDIDAMKPVSLPPFAGMQNDYRSELATYAADVIAYYGRLGSIASFVVERSTLIEKASAGLGALGELTKKGVTEEQVMGSIETAKAAVEAAVSGLRALISTSTPVYSSETLLAKLDALASVLADIEKGLAEKNGQLLSRGTAAFSQLLSGDWQSALFAPDAAGLEQLANELTRLRDDAAAVTSARDQIVSARYAVGFLALVCAVGAVLCGSVAWLR